jgi:antitoxin component of MazEF toxin-antitoxin module
VPNLKLQKQLSRKVGDKKYPKWMIAIPPKQIEALGWNEGQSLEGEIADQKLVIKKVNDVEVEKRKKAAEKAWEKRKRGE